MVGHAQCMKLGYQETFKIRYREVKAGAARVLYELSSVCAQIFLLVVRMKSRLSSESEIAFPLVISSKEKENTFDSTFFCRKTMGF